MSCFHHPPFIPAIEQYMSVVSPIPVSCHTFSRHVSHYNYVFFLTPISPPHLPPQLLLNHDISHLPMLHVLPARPTTSLSYTVFPSESTFQSIHILLQPHFHLPYSLLIGTLLHRLHRLSLPYHQHTFHHFKNILHLLASLNTFLLHYCSNFFPPSPISFSSNSALRLPLPSFHSFLSFILPSPTYPPPLYHFPPHSTLPSIILSSPSTSTPPQCSTLRETAGGMRGNYVLLCWIKAHPPIPSSPPALSP